MSTIIVSIEKDGDNFYGLVETKRAYREWITNGEMIVWLNEYKKSEFKNYEHFVGVLSKFNPYTFFLKTPVEIPVMSRLAIEETWKDMEE